MSKDEHQWLKRTLADCREYADLNGLRSVSTGLQFTLAMFEQEPGERRTRPVEERPVKLSVAKTPARAFGRARGL